VVVFNFGWYYEDDDGYKRKGGHWVAVVGVGTDANEFYVHNPAIQSNEQTKKTSLVLNRLDEDFNVTDTGVKDVDEINMIGYYNGEGAGLPHSNSMAAAILDSVIVFSLK